MAAPPILTQNTTMTFNSVQVNGIISMTDIASGTASEIDVTTLASAKKEYVQGLGDNGAFTITVIRNQDDAGQLELWDSLGSQSTETVVITLPTSTANVLTFEAFVQKFTLDIDADNVVRGTVTLRITGDIAFT